ncbi:PREDICTED: uncharacterized protein LOC106816633 [Priapulus caudatus]|uniref:Uncharacterized protein LOC106816633 n=1 Tax=Priapulus caudatus TaxID=37621 RepID=A0ABM1EX22_PRICU|nr:PREDICTED: uncharacterized protein LOC106816633 [Priapulus caudatus]
MAEREDITLIGDDSTKAVDDDSSMQDSASRQEEGSANAPPDASSDVTIQEHCLSNAPDDSPTVQHERMRRQRTLTERGQNLYMSRVADYKSELSRIQQTIGTDRDLAIGNKEKAPLLDIRYNVVRCFDRYKHVHGQFIGFLEGTNTENSTQELIAQQSAIDRVSVAVQTVLQKIDITVKALDGDNVNTDVRTCTTSRHSSKSGSSRAQSRSSARLQQLQKAEAARARLKFAERAANIKREEAQLEENEKVLRAKTEKKKSDLKIELGLLKVEEEVAIVDAELEVMITDWSDRSSHSSVVEEESHNRRIREYVEEQRRSVQPEKQNITVGSVPHVARDVSVKTSAPRVTYTTPLVVTSPHVAPNTSFTSVNRDCQIGLLIGKDLINAHHVHEQLIGPRDAPFAQRLGLGWVVIGEVCLGKAHRPDTIHVNSFKTHVMAEEPFSNRVVET